jgi:site-specific DNA-cytosine methylase
VIDEFPSVAVVVLENSPNIVNRGARAIEQQLRLRNFQVRSGVFTASEVGAPHRRRRWYCLAVRDQHVLDQLVARMKHHAMDWSREPCARLVPRTATTTAGMRRRGKLLGNSIVPMCCTHAVRKLAGKQDRPCCKPWRGAVVLKNGPVRFDKRMWLTPVSSSWQQYNLSSSRSSQQFINQVMYEQDTQAWVAQRVGKAHVDPAKFRNAWCVNMRWVEWMMGYPPDFTA